MYLFPSVFVKVVVDKTYLFNHCFHFLKKRLKWLLCGVFEKLQKWIKVPIRSKFSFFESLAKILPKAICTVITTDA